MSDELEIMKAEEVEAPQILITANTEFDTQVATAKKYPRKFAVSLDNAKATATRNDETAQMCGYLLPVDGKLIAGASVHCARICAQAYGNLRIAQQVTGEDQLYVTAEAVAWDLETNYAVKTQYKQLIQKKDQSRYKQSQVQTNGMAAMAKAMRNSIWAVIPKSFYQEVYDATRRKLTGDLTTEDKMVLKRKQLIALFDKNYGINEAQILKHFKFRQITQIKQEEILHLLDLNQSFADKVLFPSEVFEDVLSSSEAQSINEKLTGKKAEEPKVEKPVTEPEPIPIIPEPQPQAATPAPAKAENIKEPKLI